MCARCYIYWEEMFFESEFILGHKLYRDMFIWMYSLGCILWMTV